MSEHSVSIVIAGILLLYVLYLQFSVLDKIVRLLSAILEELRSIHHPQQ
jgi:hypothetical protein